MTQKHLDCKNPFKETALIPLKTVFFFFFFEWFFDHVVFWALLPFQEMNEYLGETRKKNNTMQYNNFILVRISERLKIQNLAKFLFCFVFLF